MAVDTERKRWGMMQWASGPAYYPTLFNPDTSGVDATERATLLKLYGGVAWDGPTATATLSGTATSATEADIRAGGKTIVLTLEFDTWVATVGADNSITTALIAGIDSDAAEATGWDAVVKAGLAFGDVTRDSNTVVTILLPAFASYDITANETITVTVPATALTGAVETGATPTFDVTFVAAVSARTGGGRGSRAKKTSRYPRRVVIDGVVYWAKSAEHERQLLEQYRAKIEAEALELAITDAPAEVVAKAKVKVKRAQKRVEKVDTREELWMQKLRDEDDEILLVLH